MKDIDKIEHAVVYAYNYQVHIAFFDNAICELQDRVQDALNLLQAIQREDK